MTARPSTVSKLTFLLTLLLAASLSAAAPPASANSSPAVGAGVSEPAGELDPAVRERVARAYGKVPLQFEANRGQTDAGVRFLARGRGYTLFLTDSGTVIASSRPVGEKPGASAASAAAERCAPREVETETLRMTFVDADPSARPIGGDALSGRVNYFRGNDPAGWLADVPTHATVTYPGIYRGVDLVYHGNRERIEYDFRIAARASLRPIRLRFPDADALRVDSDGRLAIAVEGREFAQEKPVAYQERDGKRIGVSVRYAVLGQREVGFRVGRYDRSRPLVIDPVIAYSTFLGGSSTDRASSIAIVSATGDAVVVGTTYSTGFPLDSALQSTYHGSTGFSEAFVSKLNAAGSDFIYSTYLGGHYDDNATGVAVDAAGNAYVTGNTDSDDFPTANPIYSALKLNSGGYICHFNAFVAKLTASGNALTYSTYLGGTGDGARGESTNGIALDTAGSAYVAGSTFSADFPAVNAIQGTLASNFLFKSTDATAHWSLSETGLPKRTPVALEVSPKNPSVIWVSFNDGGVWRSTNGGSTWARRDSGISTGGNVSVLVADPSNELIAYAAGGTNVQCYYDGGVFKTIDGGATWTQINTGLTNHAIRSLAIDKQHPQTLFAGTDGHFFPNSASGDSTVLIFKTTDGGAHWNPSETGIPHPNYIQRVAVDPLNGSIVYANTSSHFSQGVTGSGFFKSVDGGANWTEPNTTIFGGSVLALDPADSGTLYAGISFTFQKSTDGGVSWTPVSSGLTGGTPTDVAINPLNDDVLYAATAGGLFKSANGGTSWTAVPFAGRRFPNVEVVRVHPTTPSIVYAGLERQSDAFLTKIGSAGSAIAYSTFLGGSGEDRVAGVAVSGAGVAYLAGSTASTNFPTDAPFQASSSPCNAGFDFSCEDAFVARFNAAGSSLDYATYLGGNNSDEAGGIAIDATGAAYVAGTTRSSNFPTQNAYQPALGGFTDAFLTKLNPAGSSLVFSTYLGKSSLQAAGVAVDGTGAATVVGSAFGDSLPLVKPIDCSGQAFAARFAPSGSSLSYSTLLGGTESERANGVALDASGNAYVAGATNSEDFTTVDPLQPTFGGGNCATGFFFPCDDAFVTRIARQGVSGSDLVLVKCVNQDFSTPGYPVTFTLHVTNAGPLTATGVHTSDMLPAGLSLLSATPSQGTCTGTSNVQCNLGTLNNDTEATVKIVVKPDAPGPVTNTANATVTSTDPNASNNTSVAEAELEAQLAVPQALAVDGTDEPSSDGNGVFEPGETVKVAPTWKNISSGSLSATGAVSFFSGPSGPTYTIVDGAASYGPIAANAAGSCTSNCYSLKTTKPATRPAAHIDAFFQESLTNVAGSPQEFWSLHLGESFTDVPKSQLFYKKIETIFHNGITVGCTGTAYCPAQKVPRSQMAIFVARGIAAGAALATAGSVGGAPYNCVAGGTSLFTDILPTDISCKAVHYIAAQNVTAGCGGGKFCPGPNVTRDEMAIFMAKGMVAPDGGAAVPQTYGPDPVTGFSYSCNPASPNLHFTDVAVSDAFCKHAHFLWAKGVIAGCSATKYCPAGLVARDEMSKFLSNAFELTLYGP